MKVTIFKIEIKATIETPESTLERQFWMKTTIVMGLSLRISFMTERLEYETENRAFE